MKRLLPFLILVGFLSASCNKPETTRLAGEGREIRFAASMGQYEVKATDTSFDLHDAIGLTIGSPVAVTNRRLDVGVTELVPEYAIFWGENQAADQTADFYAYYPYGPTRDLEAGFEFAINPDQSEDGYTASDLMTALVSSAPEDGLVRLPFRHRLSRLILQIDNQLACEISEVYVGNIYGKVFVKGNQELELLGHPGTVKAGWYVLPNGQGVLALVLPPQTTVPQLIITTEDQKQFTYEAKEEVTFASGYSYSASVTLNEEALYTSFTDEVTEWVNDSDIQFMLGNFTEVLNGSDGEMFTVTGRVGTLQNQSYGNFLLLDARNRVLRVYGTRNSDGQYPKEVDLGWMNKEFSLLPGDIVTVRGERKATTEGVDLVDVTILGVSKKSIGLLPENCEVGRTGGMDGFYARLSHPDLLELATNDSWISQFEGPFQYTGDWYWIRFLYEANFLNGDYNYSPRWGHVTLSDGETQVSQTIRQKPYPAPMFSLRAVANVSDGTIVSFTGIVHAVSSRSYLLYDGNTAINVYKGTQGPSCHVGDQVTTIGTKTWYQGVPEVTDVETTSVLSSGNDLVVTDYQDISFSFDTFSSSASVPVQVDGVLSISADGKAYVTVDGMETTCFIYWYPDVASLQSLDGKKVRVKGFYFGVYASHKDIIATSVSSIL